MNQLLKTISALAIGAGAAYYLDPTLGRQRRAQANDKLHTASRSTQEYLHTQRERATERARGLMASARGSLGSKQPSDKRLNARLRTRLASAISYPDAIETEVVEGRAVLRGHVLSSELDSLIATAETMPGIKGVDNQLMLHERAEGVPELQDAPRRSRRMIDTSLLGEAAAPALALAGGLGAGYRALYRRPPARRSGPLSLALALLAYGVGDGARRIAQHRRAAAAYPDTSTDNTLRMTTAATPPAEFSPMMPGTTH